MSKMKLEVGKRYETRDGRVAFVSFDAGDRIWGIIEGSNGTKIWTQDGCVWGGIQNHHLDLIRCLDDEPELVDLTKIDVPFGELDERTQDRLGGAWARGCVKLQNKPPRSDVWRDMTVNPLWSPDTCYRLKPTYTMPSVDNKVWLAMPGAKAVAWDSGDTHLYVYSDRPTRGAGVWEHSVGKMSWIDEAFFGDLIQRGDCPWDQAIVLRPEGL